MATADAQAAALFVEQMRAALPQATSNAFGGVTELATLDAGLLPLLLTDFDGTHHLHLELEASAGRLQGRPLLLILRPADATQLFGLEPVEPELLGDAETQLRVLAEFTEGGEALAEALAGVLAAAGSFVTLRVSGASLEEADASPMAATLPLGDGDVVAFTMTLARPPGQPMPVIVAAPADLAAAIGAGSQPEEQTAAVGASAAERAANLAARVAARQQAPPAEPPQPAMPAPFATVPQNPAVIAHPFAFGQLDPGPQARQADRNIDPILDVALQVRVELGATEMTVEEVLALSIGSVVELDRLAGEPVDIVVNNRLLARGEVVVVEENFGVRVTELITQRSRAAG